MKVHWQETRSGSIEPTNDEERSLYNSAVIHDGGAVITFRNLGLMTLTTSGEAAALEGLAQTIRAELLQREQRLVSQGAAAVRSSGAVPEGPR